MIEPDSNTGDLTRSELDEVPVEALPSVTRDTAAALRRAGVRNAWDVWELGLATLDDIDGVHGVDPYADVCVLLGEPTPAEQFRNQ